MSAAPARTERLIPLSRRIVELLERERGKRLSVHQIAAKLGMETGDTGEGWQNVCKLNRELAILQERQKLSYAAPPEHTYWIEPTRGEVRG